LNAKQIVKAFKFFIARVLVLLLLLLLVLLLNLYLLVLVLVLLFLLLLSLVPVLHVTASRIPQPFVAMPASSTMLHSSACCWGRRSMRVGFPRPSW